MNNSKRYLMQSAHQMKAKSVLYSKVEVLHTVFDAVYLWNRSDKMSEFQTNLNHNK